MLGAALARAELMEKLSDQAVTDELTGLPNRRAWYEHLEQALARAGRTSQPLSIVMLDLDGFKRVNDEDGHVAGDRLLKSVTSAWTGELRATDVLGRIGGDEFAVILELTDAEAARDDRHRGSTTSLAGRTAPRPALRSGTEAKTRRRSSPAPTPTCTPRRKRAPPAGSRCDAAARFDERPTGPSGMDDGGSHASVPVVRRPQPWRTSQLLPAVRRAARRARPATDRRGCRAPAAPASFGLAPPEAGARARGGRARGRYRRCSYSGAGSPGASCSSSPSRRGRFFVWTAWSAASPSSASPRSRSPRATPRRATPDTRKVSVSSWLGAGRDVLRVRTQQRRLAFEQRALDPRARRSRLPGRHRAVRGAEGASPRLRRADRAAENDLRRARGRPRARQQRARLNPRATESLVSQQAERRRRRARQPTSNVHGDDRASARPKPHRRAATSSSEHSAAAGWRPSTSPGTSSSTGRWH